MNRLTVIFVCTIFFSSSIFAQSLEKLRRCADKYSETMTEYVRKAEFLHKTALRGLEAHATFGSNETLPLQYCASAYNRLNFDSAQESAASMKGWAELYLKYRCSIEIYDEIPSDISQTLAPLEGIANRIIKASSLFEDAFWDPEALHQRERELSDKLEVAGVDKPKSYHCWRILMETGKITDL